MATSNPTETHQLVEVDSDHDEFTDAYDESNYGSAT